MESSVPLRSLCISDVKYRELGTTAEGRHMKNITLEGKMKINTKAFLAQNISSLPKKQGLFENKFSAKKQL